MLVQRGWSGWRYFRNGRHGELAAGLETPTSAV